MSTEENRERLERVKAEITAFKAAEKAVWGGIDDLLLARYVAGETRPEEAERVELAAKQYPAVRTAIDVVTSVLNCDREADSGMEHRERIRNSTTSRLDDISAKRINQSGNGKSTER